jgi:hypothetical protein
MKMTRQDLEREVRRFDRNGVIDAREMVKAAKAKTHPLHDHFTWDDSKAGQLWRLQEAAQLIIRVLEPAEEEEGPEVRAYISRVEDRTHRSHQYVRRELVMRDQVARLDSQIDALAKSRAMLVNVGGIELQPLLQVLDVVLAKLRRDRSSAAIEDAAA